MNLVLFLLWCAWSSRPLDDAALAAAEATVASWQRQVVGPLRGVRRDLKGSPLPGIATEGLRAQIKALELAAERLEQDALFAAAPPPSARAPTTTKMSAQSSLALYAAHLGRELPSRAVHVLLDPVEREGRPAAVPITGGSASSR